MRKKLASVTALFGLVATLFLGVAGTAQATNPDYTCGNVAVVQICDNDVDFPVDIKVTIEDTEILTENELTVLEAVLKAVTDVDVTKNDIKVAVVEVYDNEFDIDILSNNVIVVGNIPCGC